METPAFPKVHLVDAPSDHAGQAAPCRSTTPVPPGTQTEVARRLIRIVAPVRHNAIADVRALILTEYVTEVFLKFLLYPPLAADGILVVDASIAADVEWKTGTLLDQKYSSLNI
jgi:hypothetical protein